MEVMEAYTGCDGNTNRRKLTQSRRGDCMGTDGGGFRYRDL